MAEQDRYNRCEKKLDSMDRKLDIIANKLAGGASSEHAQPAGGCDDRSGPQWDEWLQFCDVVKDFDTQNNQYILVLDAVPHENIEGYSMLRQIAWKMILDFDPMSEEEGFYQNFTSKEGQKNPSKHVHPRRVGQNDDEEFVTSDRS